MGIATRDNSSVRLLLLGALKRGFARFQVLQRLVGLVLTAVIVVAIASWAGHEFRLGEALLNAAVLALLSYFLFIRALGQTMSVCPWFIAN